MFEISDLHLYHKALMRIQVQLEIPTTTCGLVSLFKEVQKTCSHLFKCATALFEDSEDLIIVLLINDADQRN